jgi:hypothetical protein
MNKKVSQESIEEAPLEQNEKNLECDGFPYKVVQEEPKAHEINVSDQFLFNMFSITPLMPQGKLLSEH